MELKQKTICLCAIVKNEEAVIGRLIDSCIDILDYWVIYDTGSTDKTKDIIREKLKDIPGELEDSTFVNFGHNRTEVVQRAFGKADYLLLMDADMTVNLTKNFDKSKLDKPMYHIRYTGNLDFAQPLFVSGHIKWRYEGVTHEYITCAEGLSPVEYNELIITHHFDGGTRPEKLTRDRDLLERDIIDRPGNVRSYFYLAQTYANLKMFDKAIMYYQERINRGGWPEEVYYSKYQIGIMKYSLRQYDSAKLSLLDGFEYRSQRFECLYMLGVICRELKQYNQAAVFQRAAIDMPYPSGDVLFVHRNQWEHLAHFELGIVYYWLGDYKNAEKACKVVEKAKSVPKNIADQNKKNLRFALERQGKVKPSGPRDFIVVSMFTVGTEYEVEVNSLKQSLDTLSIKYEIVGVKPQGSWEKNTQIKPVVIRQVMDKYRMPVVWIDADAIVKKTPEFFTTVREDLSYYTLKWPNGFNEMLVGTVYFDYNDKVMKFLELWAQLNQSNNFPDGKNFQTLMEKNESLTVKDLPADYIKIFDNDLIVSKDPVVVHNQASRRLKKEASVQKKDIVKTILSGIAKKHERCSVVGNGPFKRNMSKQIDESFVMRCNNFQINGFDGIGTRTDVNISSLNPEIVPKEKVDYPILGILPLSDTLYQQYTTAKMMHKFWQQEAVKLVNMENTVITYDDEDEFAKLFSQVAYDIQAFPTVGVMAIAAARWLGFKEILITGFTFFQSGPSHYFKDEIVIPSSHHNTLAEAELVANWINDGQKDGIKYILDDLTTLSLSEYVSTESNTAK